MNLLAGRVGAASGPPRSLCGRDRRGHLGPDRNHLTQGARARASKAGLPIRQLLLLLGIILRGGVGIFNLRYFLGDCEQKEQPPMQNSQGVTPSPSLACTHLCMVAFPYSLFQAASHLARNVTTRCTDKSCHRYGNFFFPWKCVPLSWRGGALTLAKAGGRQSGRRWGNDTEWQETYANSVFGYKPFIVSGVP